MVNISTVKVFEQQPDQFSRFFSDPYFRDFFGSPFHDDSPKNYREQSMGSGIIVSADGLVITNNHVTEEADEIKVILHDRKEYMARVVGSDPKTDLALIRIPADRLPTIPWGDSENLEVGEFVLAIGSPFGLSRTVTMGIISATGRANVGIADYEDFIQTDAAINPGNSGGPLVNIRGELIGINTAIFSRSGGYQGIGFAVPGNMVRRVMDQLLAEGRVSRGWLGVTIQEVNPEMAAHFGLPEVRGALVGDVMKSSPAEEAGIMRGDVIRSFSGRDVQDASSFRNLVASTPAGRKTDITVWRDGKEVKLQAVIAELPSDRREAPRHSAPSTSGEHKKGHLGLSVIGLSRDIQRQLDIEPGDKGVVVVRVEPGSPADNAGLRKADVIQEVNGVRVVSVSEFDQAIKSRDRDKSLLFYVNRYGRRFYAVIPE